MRTIKLLCAPILLLLLTGCTSDKPQPDMGPLTSNDNSPILIADGSVLLNQEANFRVHAHKKASVRHLGHTPTWIGYQCDPGTPRDSGNCITDCASAVTSRCKLDLRSLDSWSLAAYDSTATLVATLSWSSSSASLIPIALPNSFTVEDGAHGGVDLKPSGNPLQSATLSTTAGGSKKSYTFQCAPKAECLRIGYYCAAGCPDK